MSYLDSQSIIMSHLRRQSDLLTFRLHLLRLLASVHIYNTRNNISGQTKDQTNGLVKSKVNYSGLVRGQYRFCFSLIVMIEWRLSSLIRLILSYKDYATQSCCFFSYGISTLVIINADDIKIDNERFIHEIQIISEIWELADWHKWDLA